MKNLKKTFPKSMGNDLIRVSWIISKFGIEMPYLCGHVTGEIEFLNKLEQTRGSRSQRRATNVFFLILFYPLGPYLFPITTETGTEVEHYRNCINCLVKFSHDLHYYSQGVRYVKNYLLTRLVTKN